MKLTTPRPKLPTPLRYIGGKHYLAPWHVSRFPPHARFVDACVGGGSVLLHYLATTPRPRNVVANDLSREVVNFWTVLRDHPEPFLHKCLLTPLSRQLVADLTTTPPPDDPVGKAWRFFVLNRQSFSGTGTGEGKAWHWSISKRTRRGINESVSAFLAAVDGLPAIADALRPVALDCNDIEAVIRRYDDPGNFVYADPPYFLSSVPNTHYEGAFTVADHERVARCLRRIAGKALVCGYDSDFYNNLYEGWWKEIQPTTLHATTTAVKPASPECIWCNYVPPGV